MTISAYPYRTPNFTRQQVWQGVRQNFPKVSPERIMDLLDLYGLEPTEQQRERVQMAILQLCNGDLHRLFELIELAKHDYRSLLYQADHTYF